jgi:predicted MPP superfamily phosphohydrolase
VSRKSGEAHTALIVHLSDLHCKADGGNNVVSNRAEAIGNALAARFDIQRPDVCVIALTGDIGYSGDPKEYAVASELLRTLRAHLSGRLKAPVHIVTTPGNHDCNFRNETSVRTTLLDALSHDGIDQAIVDECVKVQTDYRTFAQQHETGGVEVTFAGLGATVGWLRFGDKCLRPIRRHL